MHFKTNNYINVALMEYIMEQIVIIYVLNYYNCLQKCQKANNLKLMLDKQDYYYKVFIVLNVYIQEF